MYLGLLFRVPDLGLLHYPELFHYLDKIRFPFLNPLSDPDSLSFPGPELIRYLNSLRNQDPDLSRIWIRPLPVSVQNPDPHQ